MKTCFLKLTGPFLSLAGLALAQTPVLTYHNDSFRTGWNHNETILTQANVSSSSFGLLTFLPADGKVDAEPLYVPKLSINGATHNVVFVATENDTVYAYDADTGGAPLWQVTMLQSGEIPSDDRGCGQVTPEIGVTATPVIDTKAGTHGTMYVVAMSKSSATGTYYQRLHALDLTTGAEQFNGPVTVQATYPGTGDGSSGGNVVFNPAQYKERPALLITNGEVITTWSSHCDDRPYTGWVIGYNETSLAQVSVLNVTPNGNEGAIWQSGAGPGADSSGNIYFLDANGTFDTTLTSSGFPINNDYGNAFIKISNSAGKLAVADYFTMYNTVSESDTDTDLGSGGEMLLPNLKDATGKERELIIGAGKDSNIYVVDRTNMGKFNASSNNVYQELTGAIPNGIWSAPAYYNGYVFFGGVNDVIRAFGFYKGKFRQETTTTHQFSYPGITPSISSNGTTNGIVWAVENSNPAVLHAYNVTNLATELYNSTQAGTRDQFGNGNKYITAMIANGKVYAASQTGVGVFGLLASGNATSRAETGKLKQ